MSLTEDTILQRVVVRRTAQKRAPITAHGSSGCYTDIKLDWRAFMKIITTSIVFICSVQFLNAFDFSNLLPDQNFEILYDAWDQTETSEGRYSQIWGTLITADSPLSIFSPFSGRIAYITDDAKIALPFFEFNFSNVKIPALVLDIGYGLGLVIYNIDPAEFTIGQEIFIGDYLGLSSNIPNSDFHVIEIYTIDIEINLPLTYEYMGFIIDGDFWEGFMPGNSALSYPPASLQEVYEYKSKTQ
jgi:hypothetical protein